MAYPNNSFNGFSGGYLPQNYQYGTNTQYQGYQPLQGQMSQPMNEFKFMSESETMAYVVNPNCRLYALDGKNNKFYIKSTDSLGNSCIEKYSLSKIGGEAETEQPKETSKLDLSNYLTKDDFDKAFSMFKTEMNAKIEDLSKIKKILSGEKSNG